MLHISLTGNHKLSSIMWLIYWIKKPCFFVGILYGGAGPEEEDTNLSIVQNCRISWDKGESLPRTRKVPAAKLELQTYKKRQIKSSNQATLGKLSWGQNPIIWSFGCSCFCWCCCIISSFCCCCSLCCSCIIFYKSISDLIYNQSNWNTLNTIGLIHVN